MPMTIEELRELNPEMTDEELEAALEYFNASITPDVVAIDEDGEEIAREFTPL